MKLASDDQGILFACKRMDAKGWVANHDGNLSLRVGDRFRVTPTARAKFDLETQDLITVDGEGKTIEGQGKVFSEFSFHRSIYDLRPDVGAVVHAHSPAAMAVGLANQEMVTWAIPEAVVSLGPGIPLVGLGLPQDQVKELSSLVDHYDATLVGGNGVFAWGPSLELAFLRLELVEHLANIYLKTMSFGQPQMLEGDQLSTLLKKRESAGLARPMDPGRPHWFKI